MLVLLLASTLQTVGADGDTSWVRRALAMSRAQVVSTEEGALWVPHSQGFLGCFSHSQSPVRTAAYVEFVAQYLDLSTSCW